MVAAKKKLAYFFKKPKETSKTHSVSRLCHNLTKSARLLCSIVHHYIITIAI